MIVYQDTQRRPVTPRRLLPFGVAVLALALTSDVSTDDSRIGREVSVAQHLADGEEFQISLDALFDHRKKLFTADWTSEEGGGRPLTKGNGKPLSDLSTPGRCRVVLANSDTPLELVTATLANEPARRRFFTSGYGQLPIYKG
jgi:hypothetical protein